MPISRADQAGTWNFGDWDALKKNIETPQEAIQRQQLDQAKQFRSGLPAMQNQMATKLAANANRNLSGTLDAVQTGNNRRGLAYGGINEGMKQDVTGRAKSTLAGQVSGVNQQLNAAADSFDKNAMDTGFNMQSQQQQQQNQIYQNAMQMQATENQATGSLASMGLMAMMFV